MGSFASLALGAIGGGRSNGASIWNLLGTPKMRRGKSEEWEGKLGVNKDKEDTKSLRYTDRVWTAVGTPEIKKHRKSKSLTHQNTVESDPGTPTVIRGKIKALKRFLRRQDPVDNGSFSSMETVEKDSKCSLDKMTPSDASSPPQSFDYESMDETEHHVSSSPLCEIINECSPEASLMGEELVHKHEEEATEGTGYVDKESECPASPHDDICDSDNETVHLLSETQEEINDIGLIQGFPHRSLDDKTTDKGINDVGIIQENPHRSLSDKTKKEEINDVGLIKECPHRSLNDKTTVVLVHQKSEEKNDMIVSSSPLSTGDVYQSDLDDFSPVKNSFGSNNVKPSIEHDINHSVAILPTNCDSKLSIQPRRTTDANLNTQAVKSCDLQQYVRPACIKSTHAPVKGRSLSLQLPQRNHLNNFHNTKENGIPKYRKYSKTTDDIYALKEHVPVCVDRNGRLLPPNSLQNLSR